MMRFYIKDNDISFSLLLDQYSNEEEANAAASLVNSGYDSFIDRETDHSRWKLENGVLTEISLEDAINSVSPLV